MLPSEVNNVQVRDTTEFLKDGTVANVKVYTFFVGANHGPFQEKFYAGEQDAPSVERRINAVVLNLRTLGILPTNPTS
jgi:hypothetical protein